MKKLFSIILFILLIALPSWATDYYIDTTCSGTGATYNPAGPACTGGSDQFMETIANLNAKTFSAGDNIYFRKGQTWSQSAEWVTLGDGTSGNEITVSSFDTGAQPIITYTGSDGDTIEIDDEYWIISNLEITNPNGGHAIRLSGNHKWISILNNTIHDTRYMAVRTQGVDGYGGVLIDGNTMYNIGLGGTTYDAIYFISTSLGTTITNNHITIPALGEDCVQQGGSSVSSGDIIISNNYCNKELGTFKQCFVIDAYPPSSLLLEKNYCLCNDGLTMNGVYLHPGLDGGAIIRYNYFENMEFGVYNNVTDGTVEFYGNIVKNSNKAFRALDNTVSNVYNNSWYDTDQGLTQSGGTVNFKNNIMQITGPGQRFITHTGGTLNADYNLYYPAQNDAWMYNSSNYDTLAQWQSASSQDANSPAVADPLFSAAGSYDFTLLPGSPAIDVGVDLTATYDDALDPDTTWIPNAVALLDQDLFGAGWDIGAYVYDLFISGVSPTGTGVGIDTDLNWTNPTGTVTVDVYFEEVSGACDLQVGDLVVDDGDVATYEPGTMTISTSYCWRVDVNHAGGTETGTVYEFTTTGGPPAPPTGLSTASYHSLGMTGSHAAQGATVGE